MARWLRCPPQNDNTGRSPVESLRPGGSCVSQRPLQVRAAEVRLLQMRVAEDRLLQVRAAEGRLLQVRAAEGRLLQVRAAEGRLLQVRAAEGRLLQVRAAEARVPQIDRMQVESVALALRRQREAATAKHRQACLRVRGPDLQLRHLSNRRGGDVLAGQARRPGGVAAHERGQHLADGGAVGGGVAGDSLQGVDAAEPHVELGVAELVDRAGEPLGDLALLGDLELLAAVGKLLTAVGHLPVGEVRAHQQHHPAEPLQQGRADLVLHLQPLQRPVMHKPGWCRHQRQPQHAKHAGDSCEDRQPSTPDGSPCTPHGRIVAPAPAGTNRAGPAVHETSDRAY